MQYSGIGSSGKKPFRPVVPYSLPLRENEQEGLFVDPQQQHPFDTVRNRTQPQQKNIFSSFSTEDSAVPWHTASWVMAKEEGTPSRTRTGSSPAGPPSTIPTPTTVPSSPSPSSKIEKEKREKLGSQGMTKGINEVLRKWEGSPVLPHSETQGKDENEERTSSLRFPLSESVFKSAPKKRKNAIATPWAALASVIVDSANATSPTSMDPVVEGEKNSKKRQPAAGGKEELPSSSLSMASSTAGRNPERDSAATSTGKSVLYKRKQKKINSPPSVASAYHRKDATTTLMAHSVSSSFYRPLPHWKNHRTKWVVVTPEVFYIEVDPLMGEGKERKKIASAQRIKPSGSVGEERSGSADLTTSSHFRAVGLTSRKGSIAPSFNVVPSLYLGKDGEEKKKKSSPSGTSAPVVSSSSSFSSSSSSTPTYEDIMKAERLSIAKLLIIALSVEGIFCSFPGKKSVQDYVQKVDKASPTLFACTPRMTTAAPGGDVGAAPMKAMAAAAVESTRASPSTSPNDTANALVAERILVENTADHFFCIHVRDTEQLKLPEHLLFLLSSSSTTPKVSSTGAASLSSPSCTRKKNVVQDSHKGNQEERADVSYSHRSSAKAGDAPSVASLSTSSSACQGTVSPSSTATSPSPSALPLNAVERLRELQKWRFAAFRLAEESLTRFEIPPNVHAITRLRLHEPSKVDVTVVQSCGGLTKPDDIIAAWEHFSKGIHSDRGAGTASGAENVYTPGKVSSTLSEEEKKDRKKEEMMKAIFLAAFAQQIPSERAATMRSLAAMGLISPFVVRPLLTVYASCMPRREKCIGQRVPPPTMLEKKQDVTEEGNRRASLQNGVLIPPSISLTAGGAGEKCGKVLPNTRLPSPVNGSLCGSGGDSNAHHHTSSPSSSTHPNRSKAVAYASLGSINSSGPTKECASVSPCIQAGRRRRSSSSLKASANVSQVVDKEEYSSASLPLLPRCSTELTLLLEHRRVVPSSSTPASTVAASLPKRQKRRKQIPQKKEEGMGVKGTGNSSTAAISSKRKETSQCNARDTVNGSSCVRERKDESPVTAGFRLPRVYCLIKNGPTVK